MRSCNNGERTSSINYSETDISQSHSPQMSRKYECVNELQRPRCCVEFIGSIGKIQPRRRTLLFEGATHQLPLPVMLCKRIQLLGRSPIAMVLSNCNAQQWTYFFIFADQRQYFLSRFNIYSYTMDRTDPTPIQ